MTTPGNGSQITHTPSSGTPYTGAVSGSTLTITYTLTFDGETSQVQRVYNWDETQDRWQRTSPLWQRIFTPANPPTTPQSGTYVVREQTEGGFVTREQGTYQHAA